MVKVFQIYYNQDQRKTLDPGMIPYFNDSKSIFVENQCFIDIRNSTLIEGADYVGALSHKFQEKTSNHSTYEHICDCIKSHPGADIFSPKLKNYKFIKQKHKENKFKYIYEPNQLDMRKKTIPLLRHMADSGIIKRETIRSWMSKFEKPVFCNFWIARTDIFVDYVDNFLSKVIELVNGYDDDNWVFELDDKYPHTPPEDWVTETKFETYPIITFIMERLINIYIIDKQLNHCVWT